MSQLEFVCLVMDEVLNGLAVSCDRILRVWSDMNEVSAGPPTGRRRGCAPAGWRGLCRCPGARGVGWGLGHRVSTKGAG
jgi:hypothetical protein